jgi:hypothetical protein
LIPRRRWSSSALPVAVLPGATCLAAALAGLVAGLSVAAGGLALAGRALFDAPPERAQVFLVFGPLLGLLPVSFLALAAARYHDVARCAPAALALWFAAALLAASWFGLRALLT